MLTAKTGILLRWLLDVEGFWPDNLTPVGELVSSTVRDSSNTGAAGAVSVGCPLYVLACLSACQRSTHCTLAV